MVIDGAMVWVARGSSRPLGCLGTVLLAFGLIGLTKFASSYKYSIPATVFGVTLLRSALIGKRERRGRTRRPPCPAGVARPFGRPFLRPDRTHRAVVPCMASMLRPRDGSPSWRRYVLHIVVAWSAAFLCWPSRSGRIFQ